MDFLLLFEIIGFFLELAKLTTSFSFYFEDFNQKDIIFGNLLRWYYKRVVKKYEI